MNPTTTRRQYAMVCGWQDARDDFAMPAAIYLERRFPTPEERADYCWAFDLALFTGSDCPVLITHTGD